MKKLYRFELAFEGKPQDVGFLRGLSDVGLPPKTLWMLHDGFDNLPVPKLDEVDDVPADVSFWFTEKGVNRFEAAINLVAYHIGLHNWQLIAAVMEDPLGGLYRDQYQTVFPLEYVRYKSPVYVGVKSVKEIIDYDS